MQPSPSDEISKRLFQAIDDLKSRKLISGLSGFCEENGFNRKRYIGIKNKKEILDLAKNDDDYLFSRGMIPGSEKINPWQISRRWRERIKKTDKIKDKHGNTVIVTEDFYSLKHYFLDKLDEAQNIKFSQVMGSHKSDKTTTSHYTVNRDKRTRNALKKLDIDLFGDIK